MSKSISTKIAAVAALLTVVMALLAVGANIITVKPALADATHQAVIGMPFKGKWAWNTNVMQPFPPYVDSCANGASNCPGLSSHPSVHHTPGHGNWATDLYAAEGTAVKLEVSYPASGLSFKWGSSSTSCGQSTLLNVLVGGVNVGWLYFAHLNNAVKSGPITNGMTLGTVHDWGGCNPGVHVHVEFKNTTNYACYVDHGNPGVTLNQGDNLGVLGSTNTGPRQACTSIPSVGSNVPSTPVAVSRANTNMAVFYNDGNGGLASRSWDANLGWSSYTWHDTFGTNGSDVINGQPCVVARDSNDMDVFYRTAQGRLIHRGWNATYGWGGPDVLVTSDDVGDPACIARDSGKLQAFYRTRAGEIKSVAWDWQNGWNLNPQLLYGPAATNDPVAIARTSDAMDVFFGKNNGNLVHLGWTSTYGWITQDWTAGAGVYGKPTAIVRNGGGDMSVYYQENGNGKVAEESWDWHTGWAWQDWAASLAGSPSAIAGVSNVIDTFYRETGGNIVDRYFTGSVWLTTNIVGTGSATGNPYAITRGTNSEEVFYWNNAILMAAHWDTTSNSWSAAPVQ